MQCDRIGSLNAFIADAFSGPDRIALIGCGCSVATEPVAEVSHFWNISQVKCLYWTASATTIPRQALFICYLILSWFYRSLQPHLHQFSVTEGDLRTSSELILQLRTLLLVCSQCCSTMDGVNFTSLRKMRISSHLWVHWISAVILVAHKVIWLGWIWDM